jgi:hypothetical protein
MTQKAASLSTLVNVTYLHKIPDFKAFIMAIITYLMGKEARGHEVIGYRPAENDTVVYRFSAPKSVAIPPAMAEYLWGETDSALLLSENSLAFLLVRLCYDWNESIEYRSNECSFVANDEILEIKLSKAPGEQHHSVSVTITADGEWKLLASGYWARDPLNQKEWNKDTFYSFAVGGKKDDVKTPLPVEMGRSARAGLRLWINPKTADAAAA